VEPAPLVAAAPLVVAAVPEPEVVPPLEVPLAPLEVAAPDVEVAAADVPRDPVLAAPVEVAVEPGTELAQPIAKKTASQGALSSSISGTPPTPESRESPTG
jgi:hypothetical protein